MIPSEDIPLILLKARLELVAYVTLFTRDNELAEEAFRLVCAKMLWRAGGFETADQLLKCARQSARQHVIELQTPGSENNLLDEQTCAALEAEWARREEGTAAEELEALAQCLSQISSAHFEAIKCRHLAGETGAQLASRCSLPSEGAYRALAQSCQFIEASARQILTGEPC